MLGAAALGLMVANLLNLGQVLILRAVSEGAAAAKDLSFDLILSFVGTNIFESMATMDILPVIVFRSFLAPR
ncbi:MAG: cation:dicarboxylase symporter family transporter [Myxococcota bacterium]